MRLQVKSGWKQGVRGVQGVRGEEPGGVSARLRHSRPRIRRRPRPRKREGRRTFTGARIGLARESKIVRST
jgi:hypothetical protein